MPGHQTSPARGWSSVVGRQRLVHAGEGAKGCPDRWPQSPRGSWHGAGAVPEPGLPIPPKGASRPRLLPSPASAPGWVSDPCTQSALTRRGSAGVLTVRCTRTHAPPKTSLPAPQHCPNQRPVPKEAAAPGEPDGQSFRCLPRPPKPCRCPGLPRSGKRQLPLSPAPSQPRPAWGWGKQFPVHGTPPPTSAHFMDAKIMAPRADGLALWSRPGRCWQSRNSGSESWVLSTP